ncbi:hypothetical protein QYM36_009696, partial [Artemia franciscana]
VLLFILAIATVSSRGVASDEVVVLQNKKTKVVQSRSLNNYSSNDGRPFSGPGHNLRQEGSEIEVSFENDLYAEEHKQRRYWRHPPYGYRQSYPSYKNRRYYPSYGYRRYYPSYGYRRYYPSYGYRRYYPSSQYNLNYPSYT